MCGIAGIYRVSPDTPILEAPLVEMLLKIEHRGVDATGIALQNDGSPEVHILKAPEPATTFLQKPAWEEFIREHLSPATRVVILHTRAATGDANPFQNENNHPISNGRTAIIHNGTISNYKELFKSLELESSCATDSDILRAILDANGLTENGVAELCKVRGWVGLAAISTEHPGTLMLAKSGADLEIACDNDFIYWASTKEAINKALRPWKNLHGIYVRAPKTDAGFITMPVDTAWIIDQQGLRNHFLFKTAPYARDVTRKVYDGAFTRKFRWLKELAEATKKTDTREACLKEQERYLGGMGGFNPLDDESGEDDEKCINVEASQIKALPPHKTRLIAWHGQSLEIIKDPDTQLEVWGLHIKCKGCNKTCWCCEDLLAKHDESDITCAYCQNFLDGSRNPKNPKNLN